MGKHLTIPEVLAIHADQIKHYGGSPAVRDIRLLEAAVYRPQARRGNDSLVLLSCLKKQKMIERTWALFGKEPTDEPGRSLRST
jgi:hypothetical protein